MTKVALTGARGQLGTVLRAELLRRRVDLRSAGGSKALTPLVDGEDVCFGDLRDPAVVDRVLEGVDVVIHLAGTSVERPLPEIIENNLRGLYELYEGARRHRVKRVVFASSNHAFGMYSVDDKLDPGCAFRPDGFYGLSKVVGRGDDADVLGQARHRGREHPDRKLPAASDGVPSSEHVVRARRLLPHDRRAASTVPDVGYLAVWGISNNTRRYWNFGEDEARLGYVPKQDSEIYAAEILKQKNPLDAVAQRYQGGGFVTIDFTPPDKRPPRLSRSAK